MKTKALTAAAALAAAVTCALAAAAVLPPEAYVDMRNEAVDHIQARIVKVEGLPASQDQGACRLDVEVVNVFRGGRQPGDQLTIAVDCAKPGAELMPGPALWTSEQAIKEAAYIEAYLGADGAVAGWQTVLLAAPSDTPECPEDTPYSC